VDTRKPEFVKERAKETDNVQWRKKVREFDHYSTCAAFVKEKGGPGCYRIRKLKRGGFTVQEFIGSPGVPKRNPRATTENDKLNFQKIEKDAIEWEKAHPFVGN